MKISVASILMSVPQPVFTGLKKEKKRPLQERKAVNAGAWGKRAGLVLSKSCQNKKISRSHPNPHPLIQQVSITHLLCQVVVGIGESRQQSKIRLKDTSFWWGRQLIIRWINK